MLLTVSALLTGISILFVGIIGFIDLISAHCTPRLKSPYGCALGSVWRRLHGGRLGFRTIISPQELPIGAVTALIGAPSLPICTTFIRGTNMLEINQLAAGYGEKEVCTISAFCLKADKTIASGPNGCGKTILIRAMAGLIPFKGSVR